MVLSCSAQQSSPLNADSTQHLQSFTLIDGSEFVGTVTDSTKDSLFVRTGAGVELRVARSAIRSVGRVSGTFVNGVYRRPDPNTARLFFAPTGRGLKSGQGYFSDAELFFPYFAVGLADFLSIGGGISLLPGASTQLFYVSPKVSLAVPNTEVSLSIGAFYTNIIDVGESDGGGAGFLYAVGSVGTTRESFTFGIGKGFAGGEFAESPVIVLGGEIQTSNSVKFLTENWILPGSDVDLLSFGVRFFGEHLSADFAFVYPLLKDDHGSRGFPFLPWVSFAYAFGG